MGISVFRDVVQEVEFFEQGDVYPNPKTLKSPKPANPKPLDWRALDLRP